MDHHRHFKGLLLAVLIAATAGCVALPSASDRMEVEPIDSVLDRYDDSWFDERPAVSRYGRQGQLVVHRRYPIPRSVGAQEVEFQLFGAAKLRDLAAILNEQGIATIIRDLDVRSSDEDEDPEETPLLSLSGQLAGVTRFKGTVSELAQALRDLRDVEVEFRGGHLVLRDEATYYIQVPQTQGLSESLARQIRDLGALSVHGESNSGMIIYRAQPETAERIDRYVQHIASNAATVHLQVAIIRVQIEERRRQGVDWSSLSMRFGDVPGVEVESSGRALLFSSRQMAEGEGSYGLGLNVERTHFGLQAVIDALSEYGEASAEQDVTLSTLAGTPVRIESGQEVPYVGELGAAFQGEGGGVFGQATVESVNVGLDLTIEPRYDASTDLVTSEINLDISELIAMREFEAGGGGVLTAPELNILNFTNITRLRPGQVTLLGGVTTNEYDDRYSTIAGLEKRRMGGQRLSEKKSAIFIMLRPTVTLFSDSEETETLPEPGTVSPCWPDVVLMDRNEEVRQVSSVFFRQGSADIAREQRHSVWSTVRRIDPDERVAVVGYVDPTGQDSTNRTLRESRKRAVHDLVAPLVPHVTLVDHTPLSCDETGQHVTPPYQRRAELWIIGRNNQPQPPAQVESNPEIKGVDADDEPPAPEEPESEASEEEAE
jgi:outer membrane protein OmpA-like peptidoglycan-associated protein